MTQYLKNGYLRILGILFITVIALPACAGQYNHSQYDYAEVLHVEPVTEIVQIPEEQQVCRQVPVQHNAVQQRSPGPTILGSIIGGVIGSQFGGGHGKTVATIAGATIGGAVARNAQNQRYPSQQYTTLQQQCFVETNWRNEERIIAWDVDWAYQGKTYQTRMAEHPGDRIRVRVNVDPVYP